ncbi:hypothetical protein SAMN04489733_1796 [Amycolatopsis keratiniphila]|nr:hypothetical protein SAMN04489733_1796 [Amycolatopsis keratiniphila]
MSQILPTRPTHQPSTIRSSAKDHFVPRFDNSGATERWLRRFPAGSRLFGAYGVGLAAGFFAYLVVLLIMVARSEDFGVEWFLDGRRRKPADEEHIPAETRASGAPMSREDTRLPS